MIEDATFLLDGIHFPTRLHEHGTDGYMEGQRAQLEKLKALSATTLTFYKDGQPYETKEIVRWGNVCDMTDDHEILHLEWKDDEQD